MIWCGGRLALSPRVLVVSQHYWPESFRINDISDYLVEQGCEVEVLCGLPNYPLGEIYDGYERRRNRRQVHRGVTIRRVSEVKRGSNSNLRIALNYLSFPVCSLFQLPRLLRSDFDRIFLYQTSPVMMSFVGLVLGRLRKIETTMYVLDLWPENLLSVIPLKGRLTRGLATKASHWHYRRADKLIALSDRMRQHLVAVTGVDESKIIVLPQACEKLYEVDIVDEPLRQRFAGRFNVVFTGNISPAQSFGTMIEAARLLRQRGIGDIHWIVVGDGMSRAAVEQQVRHAGLSESFSFEGHRSVEDIPRYTSLADVLVGCLVPSELLEATIPSKVMSYLAAGRSIVLAMDGEAQDLINATIRCGFAGPAGDALQLADNLERVYLLTAEQRSVIGERARAYHLAHFERNLVLSQLFRFVLGGRDPEPEPPGRSASQIHSTSA